MRHTTPLRIATLALTLALAGCATTERPIDEIMKEVQARTPNLFDKPTSSKSILAAITDWSLTGLKDPDSIQIINADGLSAQKGWVKACYDKTPYGIYNCYFYFGQIVKASMNAKNAYGGYIGYEQTHFVLHGDKVVKAVFYKDYVDDGALP